MTREERALFLRQRLAAKKGKIYVPKAPTEPRVTRGKEEPLQPKRHPNDFGDFTTAHTPLWVQKPLRKPSIGPKAKTPSGARTAVVSAKKWFQWMRWKW